MRLEYIYKNDINRNINGVIKVAQDDEVVIKQELNEYIITKELRRHFDTFLANYEKSITTPTDKIGVWISGFFGSGKSHFLKILSYILSNDIVAGKHAAEYFEDKFDDPLMFAQLERCAKVPTDTILFNIDSKGPVNKDNTAILRVFAKVFFEYRGFYGDDLKVAKLEQFVEKSGKMAEFKSEFEGINGNSWEESRRAFEFYEDDIVEVLMNVLGMSEISARNWFNGTETADMSIEQLVKDIKEYIDSKGKDFRLLFMIDEVGQYIGSDGSLMLNLQTIVEEIGSKCGGRVWVMVTSQEAIDSVTKIRGDDFSKIQGRFNTRLSLSSSSVDEVVKKRILAKNDNGANLLKLNYDKNSAVLKNLFAFKDAVLDLKGYSSEFDYIETYPLVPYQFKLMQNVMGEIRKHGNSGKHISDAERTMLACSQMVAQTIQDKDENALVPFWMFYDTISVVLESQVRRVIDRCQEAADNQYGIKPYDVEVLKLLYLIRYVDDVKANVDNISTLMVDDIRADKINMRKEIQESLDRLVSQNYVARNGDTYTFLTDDEQDIEREIRQQPVDSAQITNSIGQIIFGDLYMSKKFKYGKYDFAYDQYIDETSIGSLTGGMKLRVVTVASDMASQGDQALIMKSNVDNEAIIVLSDRYPYFEDLENAAKIRKYVKSRNISALPEVIQHIIRGKQQQASFYEKNARDHISLAIQEGKAFVHGETVDIKTSSVKDKFETALSNLVEGVYSKLGYIKHNFDSDDELFKIISDSKSMMSLGGTTGVYNKDAVDEIDQYLELQKIKMLPTSMGDLQRRFSNIPYGWREIDIAAAVVSLIAIQKYFIKYNGNTVQPSDKHLVDYLRRKSEIDKAIVTPKVAPPTALITKARDILKDYFNTMDVPSDVDGLIDYIIDSLSTERDRLQNLLFKEYSDKNYPDKSNVEKGVTLLDEILIQKKDNIALLKKLSEKEDDLLDLHDDLEEVNSFFKNQRTIYDSADVLVADMVKEKDYLQAEREANQTLATISGILKMDKPYRRISELPGLIQIVQNKYGQLLDLKRQEVNSDIQAAMAEIHQNADMLRQKDIVEKADEALVAKRDAASKTNNLTSLDAMKIQIANIKQQYLKALIVVKPDPIGPEPKSTMLNRSAICHVATLKSESDIDEYVNDIRQKLIDELNGNDVLHII